MSSSSKTLGSSSCTAYENDQLRRGPWTAEEDTMLTHYVTRHGEGRWNSLAKRSGLRRTGKSCRLRWLNYLKPDVKRGNLTAQEQLLILDLHSRWGNRWSRIAQHLPGRTDNEIKNYWRTRVQKQARHLNIETSSKEFEDIIRFVWMPRLLQTIQKPSSSCSAENLSQSSASLLDHDSQNTVNIAPLSAPSNQVGNDGYDMETLNMESLQTTGLQDFDNYPVDGHCHTESYWIDNDFAGYVWNVEELWPFNN